MSSTISPIYLPAGMVVSHSVPPVCARHGRPARQRRKIKFVSRPEPWTYVLLLVALLVMIIVQIAMQKKLTAPASPVCDECLERRKRMTIGAWAGVAAFVVSFFVFGIGSSTLYALLGLVLLLGGPIAAIVCGMLASWANILAADVTTDGGSLRLRKPAPAFVASLPPLAPVPPVAAWAGPPVLPFAPPAPPVPPAPGGWPGAPSQPRPAAPSLTWWDGPSTSHRSGASMGKRAELDWTITVDKSAEEVFDYLVDVNRHHEWSTGAFRVENVSEQPLQVGTTWTSFGFQPPKEQDHRNDVTVTERFVRPSRFAFTALDDGEEYRTVYVLTPDGSGTRLERHMDIPKPGGAAGLAFGGVVKAFIKPGVQKTLETFKANVEA